MTFDFQHSTFEELEGQLVTAAAWLERLGAEVRRSRFGRYLDDVAELVSTKRREDWSNLPERHSAYINALYEASEIIGVHQCLSSPEYDEFVRGKIVRVSDGPVGYRGENRNSNSNVGRDVAFELVTAARMVGSGLALRSTSRGDVEAVLKGKPLLIECKRIRSEAKDKRRFDEAFDQVEKHLQQMRRAGARGIIALDVTALLNPTFMQLVKVTDKEISARLNALLAAFMRKHQKCWKVCPGSKVIGVLVRVSVMAECISPRMWTYCQQFTLTNLTPMGSADFSRLDNLVKAMGADSVF